MTLTVTDEQQDEGFVPHQVDDGLFVGVILQRRTGQDGLRLAGREGGAVLDDCTHTHTVTSHDSERSEAQTPGGRQMCVRTYDGEEEEARGDGGGTVEHHADVVTHQLNVIGRVGNQNRGQQEPDGRPQLKTGDNKFI